jgi:hypothetical protein
MEVPRKGLKVEFAKYIGTADSRVMHERDWVMAGVPNQGTVTWGPANGYSVPRSALSDDAWAALGNDPGIVFTGERPDAQETTEAAIEAARRRLLARNQGAEVLHKQDEIPGSL